MICSLRNSILIVFLACLGCSRNRKEDEAMQKVLVWLVEERGLNEVLAKDILRGLRAYEEGKPWYNKTYLCKPSDLDDMNENIPKEYGILVIGLCGDGDLVVVDILSSMGTIGYLGSLVDLDAEWVEIPEENRPEPDEGTKLGIDDPLDDPLDDDPDDDLDLDLEDIDSDRFAPALKSPEVIRKELVKVANSLPVFLGLLRSGDIPYDHQEALKQR